MIESIAIPILCIVTLLVLGGSSTRSASAVRHEPIVYRVPRRRRPTS